MYILAHIKLPCCFVAKNVHSCLIRLSGIRKYGSRKPGVKMCQCAVALSKCAEDEMCKSRKATQNNPAASWTEK